MPATLIILLRVLFAAMLGLAGLLLLSIGFYLTLERGFTLLAGPGAAMLGFVMFGLGLLYGSGRLFKSTLGRSAA
jgi:hypothetical protein